MRYGCVKIFLNGLYVLWSVPFLSSTSSSLFAQQLIFKSYTAQDGLVANHIKTIFQDSKGFIWIATWEGLSKYDGHKFTNFTRANGLSWNLVNDVYETVDGKLYVALNNGDVDIIQHDAILQKAAFRNIVINKFYITSDKIVIAPTDNSGVIEFRNGKLKKPKFKLHQASYNDLTEWNDTLLAGGVDNVIHILNKRYEVLAEIKKPNIFLYSLYVDSKKRLWAGTYAGLKLFSPFQLKNKEIQFASLPPPFHIPVFSQGHITNMHEDADGNFWVGTLDQGVVKIQPDGYWQIYSEKDGLPSNQINCIFQDKEKTIWIGTSLGLAKLITQNNIRIYSTQQEVLSKWVIDLHSLGGDKMLITTARGVELYDKTTNRFTAIPSQNNAIYSIFIKNSSPLLLTDHGNFKLGVYNSSNIQIVNTDPLPIYAAVCDSDKNMFVGTEDGLGSVSGKKIEVDSCVPHRVNNLIIDSKGYLWAGTWQHGLFRIQYSIKKNKITTSVKNLTHLLPGKNIRYLFEDRKGNIWIGTRFNGVVCLSEDAGNDYRIRHWDYQHGLMATWIQTIAEDSAGNIWLGSYLGIDKLVHQDTGFRVFNFSRVNNFFASISSILPDSNNRLFFATSLGLVLITDDQTETRPALPAQITSISLGKTSKNNFSSLQKGKKTSLSYHQNQAQFEFTALGFINEKQILYSYRLKGSDDTSWSKPTNIHSVSYASLEPGNYGFEVRTSGWDGSNGIPATFDFIISPPYWQTWWFRICALLFVSGVITFFVRRRIKTIRHQAEMKQKIAETEMMALRAQMNPHFIFNCINSIDALIQSNDKYNATIYLNKFAKLIRNILDSSTQNTVPLTKDLETLKLYIELEQFRNENKFTAEIKTDEVLMQDDYKVPPLIVQPYVENAILHGLRNRRDNNGKLVISVSRRNNHLEYIIEDNGVGRESESDESKKQRKSYGMQMSKDRVKLFNNEETASVLITDLIENGEPVGTQVRVLLNIQ